VDRSRVGAHLGRRLGGPWSVALSMRLETVDADSTAEVRADDEARGVEAGDELAFGELPDGVKADVGRSERSVLGAEIVLDSRNPRQIAGTPAGGLWGRLRGESVLQYLGRARSFGAVDFDLRGYRRLLGGALAGRLRAGLVGDNAPFYDRLYLGGLYTVRGFPGQSLSDAGGDTWLWSASLEYRAPLIGETANPRLAGVVFVDAGDSGRKTDPDLRDLAASAGYGVRLRVGWLGWLGLDFGMPLTRSPLDESFRAHASIGWSF
jgi:outer membrane protein assembly factor BamA